MENKHAYLLIGLIFVASLVLNSFVIFSKPLHEDSYLSLRYTEQIQENFSPLLQDDLSYGGRSVEEPFLFYYLLALGGSIHEAFVKFLPALFISSLVIITFFISKLFVSKKLALIPALFAGFIPVILKINMISSSVLAFPILFLLIYSFARIEEKKFLHLFVILSFLLPLTSFLSIFYIFSILTYFFIVGIEKKKGSRLEGEALLFSLFVNVFITLFIFRNSLLAYGPSFIWQNIPITILSEFFQEFALINTLGNIGIAALFLGVVGFVFSFRERKSIFLASFLLTTLIFLWLRLVPFNIGLILFALTLTSLSSLSLKALFPYIKETKFSKYSKQILAGIFLLVILTSVLPSIIAGINFESKIDETKLNAINSIERKGVVILAPYEYGHAITFSKQKNVADSSFLLAPSPEKRLEDINLIYTSQSQALVLETMKRYQVDYVIFDSFVREKFNVEELTYVKDRKCFSKVYDEDETKIYRVRC